jgi:hypothetical protein
MEIRLKVFKLVTNEEVIGEVLNDRFNEVGVPNVKLTSIRNAFLIKQEVDENGKTSVEFSPWGNMITGEIMISYNQIVYGGTPTDKLKNAYMIAIGSEPKQQEEKSTKKVKRN